MSAMMNMYSDIDGMQVTSGYDTIWIRTRNTRDTFSASLQREDIRAIREALNKIEEYINGQENR
jgi:hypothetical protein